MREKRVNLVVLISSVLVATCASVSCLVTFDSSFPILDKYVAVISSIPFLLSGQISSASAATVWIPSEPAVDTDGSVQDEFSEVAHVFARPGAKVVKSRDEDEITQQPVPWTSLKNEWKIYNQVHSSKRKMPVEKQQQQVNKAVQGNDEETIQQDDESSEEDEEGDEDEDEEEEEDDEEGGGEARASSSLPNVISKVVKGSKESIPLAFFGQQNHDDDERDYLKDEANVFKRKKSSLASRNKNKDEDNEEDDVSGSNEAASVEDYADYAADEDEGDENGVKRQQQKPLTFDDIPLAIREMILNDLANHNNGSGYSPNLTPKVTGGQQRPNGNNARPPQSSSSGGSAENDESSEDNSSEEDEEEDDNPQQAPQQAPPQQFPFQSDDPDPTPPAIRPSTNPKKGDDEDEVYDDGGGKGKKGKGKKKKGKKGKGGWGKPGWGQIHLAPGWGHHEHKDHGWGWEPEKHDGVLEQLVRGSTWERVLKYYHWKRDQAVHEEKGHHHHDDHYHGPTYGGPDFGHHDHGHDDHDHHGGGGQIKGLVKGAFKGSFWERAVHTYAQYKENQAKNPKKPAVIDLDSGGGGHHHHH